MHFRFCGECEVNIVPAVASEVLAASGVAVAGLRAGKTEPPLFPSDIQMSRADPISPLWQKNRSFPQQSVISGCLAFWDRAVMTFEDVAHRPSPSLPPWVRFSSRPVGGKLSDIQMSRADPVSPPLLAIL